MDNMEQLNNAKREIRTVLEKMSDGIDTLGTEMLETGKRLVKHTQEHEMFTNELNEQFIRLTQEFIVSKGAAVSEGEATPKVQRLIDEFTAKVKNHVGEQEGKKKRIWSIFDMIKLITVAYKFFNSDTKDGKLEAIDEFLSLLDDIKVKNIENEQSAATQRPQLQAQQKTSQPQLPVMPKIDTANIINKQRPVVDSGGAVDVSDNADSDGSAGVSDNADSPDSGSGEQPAKDVSVSGMNAFSENK